MSAIVSYARAIAVPALTSAQLIEVHRDAAPFFPMLARVRCASGVTSTFAAGVYAWILRQHGNAVTQLAFDQVQLHSLAGRGPSWFAFTPNPADVSALHAMPGPWALLLAIDPLGDPNVGRYTFAADVLCYR